MKILASDEAVHLSAQAKRIKTTDQKPTRIESEEYLDTRNPDDDQMLFNLVPSALGGFRQPLVVDAECSGTFGISLETSFKK